MVITDPKQINDPLSEALAAVATEVHKLQRVKTLEGPEEKGEPPAEPLQRIMDDLDYQILPPRRMMIGCDCPIACGG